MNWKWHEWLLGVSQNLSDEQKRERERVSLDLLKSWRSEKFFRPHFTGDETWFHYYEPETKFQSSQWKRKHEGVPIKITVFWDRKGILSIDWLPEKTTINSDYYISELEELREVIKRERRGKLSKGILLNMIMRGPMSAIKQRTLFVA